MAPKDSPGRAPAALQCPQGGYGLRWTAAGAARVCRETEEEAPLLPPSSLREAGDHRVGAGLLSLRGELCGFRGKAALRPLLRQEHVDLLRHDHHPLYFPDGDQGHRVKHRCHFTVPKEKSPASGPDDLLSPLPNALCRV